MFAWFLFALIVLHAVLTFVGPLVTLSVAKRTKQYKMLGVRTLFSLIGFWIGSGLFSYWLTAIGSSKEALIGANLTSVYGLLAWALLIGGVVVVVMAFRTSRGYRMQYKAS